MVQREPKKFLVSVVQVGSPSTLKYPRVKILQDLTLQGNGDEVARANHDKHDQKKLTEPRPEHYILTTACFQAIDVEVPAVFLDAHRHWKASRTGGWCLT